MASDVGEAMHKDDVGEQQQVAVEDDEDDDSDGKWKVLGKKNGGMDDHGWPWYDHCDHHVDHTITALGVDDRKRSNKPTGAQMTSGRTMTTEIMMNDLGVLIRDDGEKEDQDDSRTAIMRIKD
eukprot:CAMPEP_0119553008 /NCGR_PEP_ID=MMETSP1352-20130426/5867_1 /TAXON_ID=265584 /ORGANISM="Stauroneis constricta, Strain CCMP1120" /LENGTH=122 /DNA_ID=CAMNT_0007599337 /DNA_START=314 /DNA_END=682 /DNA_ORIENTATION=+